MSVRRIFELTDTPRTSSISPRVMGWRYAISASVSNNAREYRGGRSSQSFCSRSAMPLLICRRNPEATSPMTMPRGAYSSPRSVIACRISPFSGVMRPSNSPCSCSMLRGRPAPSKAASTKYLISTTSIYLASQFSLFLANGFVAVSYKSHGC